MMSLYTSITMAVNQLDGKAENETFASKDIASLIKKYGDTPERIEAILKIALTHAYRQGAMKAVGDLAGSIQSLAIEAANRQQMLNDLDESLFSR